MRTIGLYLYASVKGGAGKSTLAVLAAKLLADGGRRPVVLDADVLGSSLADGLEICAPVVYERERDGSPDYGAAPTGQWHDLTATRALREGRKQWLKGHGRAPSSVALAPAFINDALFYPDSSAERDCRVDAMLWRHTQDDVVRYLPSSPLREDAIKIAPYVSGDQLDFAWVRRLAWIIDAIVGPEDAITDIIIDLPPGTWGLTHETLVLAGKMGAPLPQGYPQWHDRIRWHVVPTMVTTPDRNDRLLALEYWLATREKIPTLRVLMNRVFESQPKVRSAVLADLPEPLRSLGLEDEISFVPQITASLGRLFVQGDLRLDEDLRELSKALRLQRGATAHA